MSQAMSTPSSSSCGVHGRDLETVFGKFDPSRHRIQEAAGLPTGRSRRHAGFQGLLEMFEPSR